MPKRFDPEIPVNIYDLGLVYTIDISDEGEVDVDHDAHRPGMPGRRRDARLAGRCGRTGRRACKQVDVEITWDPPWGMDMMSDEARLELGFM